MKRTDYKRDLGLRGTIIGFAVFIALAALLVIAVNGISAKSYEQEHRILRSALVKAAVTCYAVEGSYPESLEYIEENYGVNVDREAFTVAYELTADNLMPLITVSRKGGS